MVTERFRKEERGTSGVVSLCSYTPSVLTVGGTEGSSVSDHQREGGQAKSEGDHVDACPPLWKRVNPSDQTIIKPSNQRAPAAASVANGRPPVVCVVGARARDRVTLGAWSGR